MFKNVGKALALMCSMAVGGGLRVPTKKHEDALPRKTGSSDVFGVPYGTRNACYVRTPRGHAKGRTTAAAQRRAKIKRANKRKNKKGSK